MEMFIMIDVVKWVFVKCIIVVVFYYLYLC